MGSLSARGELEGQPVETFRQLFRQLYDYGPTYSNLTLGFSCRVSYSPLS